MRRTMVVISLALLSCHILCASEVALVRNGAPCSEIVIGEKPTRTAQFAALELQHVVRLITGAQLPILPKGTGQRLQLQVGNRELAKNFKGEEYSVTFGKNAIAMVGNDTEDYGKVSYRDVTTFPSIYFYFRATLFAVYDFLEKGCGVRFYGPGDLGIAFTPRTTLTVTPFTVHRTPTMVALRNFHRSGLDQNTRWNRDYVLLRQRWRESVIYGLTNHNIWSIYFRYWDRAKSPELAKVFIEKHPEYFAQRETERYNSYIAKKEYPGQYVPSQLCYASDGPVNYFAQEACKGFNNEKVPGAFFTYGKRNMPGMPYYYPVVPDDDNAVCQCPKCREEMAKDRNGYHFKWINRIAEATAKINPQTRISTLAYGVARIHPNHVRLHPNVGVMICMAPDSWYHPLVYARQHGDYKTWVNREAHQRELFVWLYLLQPDAEAEEIHRYKKVFPILYPKHTGKYMTEVVQDGIKGVFTQLWAPEHELEGYLVARLSYDSSSSYEDILDEYYRLYYGAAGPAMKQLYELLESIGFNPKNYPTVAMQHDVQGSYIYGIQTVRNNWELGTPQRMKQLRDLVATAKAKATTATEKARVERFLTHIWKPAEEGYEDYTSRKKMWNTPVPEKSLPHYNREYHGDLTKVDFTPALCIQNWKSAYNEKVDTHDAKLKLIADSTHLYLNYTEKTPEAFQWREKACFFSNGLEIFMANRLDGSYRQIFVDPNDRLEICRNDLVNGVNRFAKMNATIKRINRLTPDSWSVSMAIPLTFWDELCLPGKTLYTNFMRMKMFDKNKSLYFSPIFSNTHIEGLNRMGKLIMPFKLDKKSRPFKTDSDFQKLNPKTGVPQGWIINSAIPVKASATQEKLHIQSLNNTYGHLFQRSLTPVVPGEKIKITFDASGNGKAGCGLYFYNRWTSTGTRQQDIQLTQQPQTYQIVIQVPHPKTQELPATNARIFFEVKGGSDMTVSQLKAEFVTP